MTTLLMLNVIALTLLAWAMVFKVLPSYETSRFRNRLWRIRDDLVDDVRHGKFEHPEPAKRLISFIELSIEDATDFTPLNVALFAAATRGYRPESQGGPLSLASASVADASRLQPVVDEVESALVAKALLGSPSGWLLALVLLPAIAYSALRDKGRPEVLAWVASTISNDLLESNRRDGPDEGLSQHVA